MDQKDGDVTTTSNFQDHKISQVIEPVVKTITSAIRQRYNKYDENDKLKYDRDGLNLRQDSKKNFFTFSPDIFNELSEERHFAEQENSILICLESGEPEIFRFNKLSKSPLH